MKMIDKLHHSKHNGPIASRMRLGSQLSNGVSKIVRSISGWPRMLKPPLATGENLWGGFFVFRGIN